MKTADRVTLRRSLDAIWPLLLFTIPAVVHAAEPEKTQPKAVRPAERKFSAPWWTFSYTSPLIGGIPKAVMYRSNAGLGHAALVCVWDDGTIAWLDETRKKPQLHFVARIPTDSIDQALRAVKEYTARSFPKRSQGVATRNCERGKGGVGLVLLDREIFVAHEWSAETLQEYPQIKTLLADSKKQELSRHLLARFERPPFDHPWEFLAHYAEYVGMKEDAFYDLKADSVGVDAILEKVAKHVVQDGDHFLFCRERIQSLVPKASTGSTLVSKPLDLCWQSMEARCRRVDDAQKYEFSYRSVK